MIGSVSDMENNYSPLDALRDVDASRTDTARRLYTPWWYHPALGLGLACLGMAVAYFDEAAIFWPLVAVAFVLPVTIAMVYRRITGVWINWPEAGPDAAKLGVVFTVILAAGIGGFARGGDFNRRNGNRLMRWRIIAQAVTIAFVLAYVALMH